jgi:hypothetical protein
MCQINRYSRKSFYSIIPTPLSAKKISALLCKTLFAIQGNGPIKQKPLLR